MSELNTTTAELEALDAALAGRPVAPEHAPLATLSLELRELRAEPSEQFARSLDARAARGFARRPRQGRSAGRAPDGRRTAQRSKGRRGAAALAGLLAAAAVTLAVVLSSSSGGPRAVSQAGPAVVANRNNDLETKAPEAKGPAAKADHMGPASGPGESAARSSLGRAAAQPSAPSASGVGPGPRQIEHSASLEVGVAPGSIQSAAQRVFALVSAFGGYVQQSNVSSGGDGGSATFDVRVPSARLPAATAALAHLGHVRSQNEATNDVTSQHDSLARSLGEAQAEHASLVKALAAASEASQRESLKARLRSVDARISELQRSLRGLDARVSYTRLALSLSAEAGAGASAGELTPGSAADDAARILDVALAVLVIGAAALLPLAAIALAAWLVIAFGRRRIREQALDAS